MAATHEITPVLQTAPPRSFSDDWTLLGMLEGGTRVAVGAHVGGGCTSFDGVVVKETSTFVSIDLRSTKSDDAICPAVAVGLIGYVQLRAPLGQRTLLHG